MKCHLAISALAALSAMSLVHAGDKEDVTAVIDEYVQYEEADDMISQGKLMTDDRAVMYVGVRRSGDNGSVMKEQQEARDRHAKKFPGVHYKIAIEDVRTQIYNGDAAFVALDWYPTRVVPASLPPEKVKELESPKTPFIVGLMLVKQAGAWKIAFTTFLPLKAAKS